MMPLVLTRKEAAAALKISEWQLDRLIADRLIPTIKIPSSAHRGEKNRRVLIAVRDLEAFIDAHREVGR
jgi:hypothetical protein